MTKFRCRAKIFERTVDTKIWTFTSIQQSDTRTLDNWPSVPAPLKQSIPSFFFTDRIHFSPDRKAKLLFHPYYLIFYFTEIGGQCALFTRSFERGKLRRK